MNRQSDANKSDDRTELMSLSEFWRPLLPSKESFGDENDYYASIRILSVLQKVISDVLTPYIRALLVASKRPGEMQALEKEIHAGVSDRSGSDEGKESLLERALGFPSPEDYVDFPAIAAEIRAWREHRPIIRCLLLLALVDRLHGHFALKNSLDCPNAHLCGESLAKLIEEGKWSLVADYLDDALIGN